MNFNLDTFTFLNQLTTLDPFTFSNSQEGGQSIISRLESIVKGGTFALQPLKKPKKWLQKLKNLNLQDSEYKRICELTMKIIFSSAYSNNSEKQINTVDFQDSQQIDRSFELSNTLCRGLCLFPELERTAGILYGLEALLKGAASGEDYEESYQNILLSELEEFRKIPLKEREEIIELTNYLSFKLDLNEISSLLQAIREIASEERASVVTSVMPIWPYDPQAAAVEEILDAVAEISQADRDNVISVAKQFSQGIVDGNEIADILGEASQLIASEEKEEIIEWAKLLCYGAKNGFTRADLLNTAHGTNRQEREEIAKMADEVSVGITDQVMRAEILRTVQSIDSKERIGVFTQFKSILDYLISIYGFFNGLVRIELLRLVESIPQNDRNSNSIGVVVRFCSKSNFNMILSRLRKILPPVHLLKAVREVNYKRGISFSDFFTALQNDSQIRKETCQFLEDQLDIGSHVWPVLILSMPVKQALDGEAEAAELFNKATELLSWYSKDQIDEASNEVSLFFDLVL